METQNNEVLIPYEDMLKAGMHFGRKRTVYNPAMKEHVFAVRDGICIIDLLKTQEALIKAIEAIKKVKEAGGLILFAAPTKQSQESMMILAEKLGMPYVMDRWLGGTLTNFKIINSRVKFFEDLEKQKATGGLDKYTKKERMMFDKQLEKMRRNFEGLKKLTRVPDLLFASSLKEGALPVREAIKSKVKVIGIANTDANPAGVSQIIPANDRSKKSVDLLLDAIIKAF